MLASGDKEGSYGAPGLQSQVLACQSQVLMPPQATEWPPLLFCFWLRG